MRVHFTTEPAELMDVETGEKSGMKERVGLIALAVILAIVLFASVQSARLAPTFAGNVDVASLQENPEDYDLNNADGAAHIIVSLNNIKTAAKNVCYSVVFNFRGYDTMGESFILITALAGSICILRTPKKKEEKEVQEDGE